ncbi:MAG: putative viral replication protein [Circoviridae sp.]|nr:MAG: putative viral replication protein [Circoviridae sp.]
MPKSRVGNAKRYYCFTINNPTDNDDKQLRNLCSSDNVSYLCYGREGKDKTVHYQGYVELTKPQRFSWIKKRLTRSHLEPKKGSRTQARDYCFKEDSAPFEYGEWKPDRQGQRNDLVVVQRLLEDPDIDFQDIAGNHFESFCKYNKFFSQYRAWHTTERHWVPKVYVFHGPTGTGKTRAAFAMPGAKQLDYSRGFFEDPENHQTLIFDDVCNPVHLFGRRLFLRLTDRYPMKVNIKNGHAEWNPKIIIFTTNDNPDDWGLDEACKRRITDVVSFTHNTTSDGEDR